LNKIQFQQKLNQVRHRIAYVQGFKPDQVQQFLRNFYKGDETAAARRYEHIQHIQNLEELAENPRMLSFIARLEDQKLQDARQTDGAITSAELYRLILTQWLQGEQDRAKQPDKKQLQINDRWRAVTEFCNCAAPRRFYRCSSAQTGVYSPAATQTARRGCGIRTAVNAYGTSVTPRTAGWPGNQMGAIKPAARCAGRFGTPSAYAALRSASWTNGCRGCVSPTERRGFSRVDTVSPVKPYPTRKVTPCATYFGVPNRSLARAPRILRRSHTGCGTASTGKFELCAKLRLGTPRMAQTQGLRVGAVSLISV